jgi:hypothetical protein
MLHSQWMLVRYQQRAFISLSPAIRNNIGLGTASIGLKTNDVLTGYLKGLYTAQQEALRVRAENGKFDMADFKRVDAPLIGDAESEGAAVVVEAPLPEAQPDHASDEHYRRLMAEPVSGIAVAAPVAAETSHVSASQADSDDEAAQRVSLLWQD